MMSKLDRTSASAIATGVLLVALLLQNTIASLAPRDVLTAYWGGILGALVFAGAASRIGTMRAGGTGFLQLFAWSLLAAIAIESVLAALVALALYRDGDYRNPGAVRLIGAVGTTTMTLLILFSAFAASRMSAAVGRRGVWTIGLATLGLLSLIVGMFAANAIRNLT